MRDRDRWDHPYDDARYDRDERYESRTRRHRGGHESRGMDDDRDFEESRDRGPGPLRGSRHMYEVDDEDRFFEQDRQYRGDYPRADMGGPYRYGMGRNDRGHGDDRQRRNRYDAGDWTGAGSAEGYTGFGGPGWQSGGYGDSGFQTSSTRRRHHRADHSIGTDLPRDDFDAGRSLSWSGRGDANDHLSRRDVRGRSYDRGPHYGRGPKDYQRSDERIREDVCERLTRHGGIDASEVEIDVSGSEVTLRGAVNDRYAKRMAEDVAESVPGVRDVFNNLRCR